MSFSTLPTRLLESLIDNTRTLKTIYKQHPELSFLHCAEPLLERDIKGASRALSQTDGGNNEPAERFPLETLKSVSARIKLAKDAAFVADHERAYQMLSQLANVLPSPDSRHVEAAEKAVCAQLPPDSRQKMQAALLRDRRLFDHPGAIELAQQIIKKSDIESGIFFGSVKELLRSTGGGEDVLDELMKYLIQTGWIESYHVLQGRLRCKVTLPSFVFESDGEIEA